MSGQQNYSQDEHAAAWAEYYRQQGYDAASIAAALGTSTTNTTTTSTSNPTSTPQYGTGQPGAYETYIPPTNPTPAAGPSYTPAPVAGGINDVDWIQQGSAYLPGAAQEIAKTVKAKAGKRETVIRHGKGKTWEDPTLIDWDPKWYRLFVGDVSNDVSERTLDTAFSKYPSFCKSKVVRDRLSLKSKYAFIAFKDPEDFLRAWKEMDGKYVGNRPIRLSKIRDDQHGTIATTKVSGKKARELDKLRRNHGKPLDGRPTPW